MPPLSVMKKRTNLQSFWNGVQELQQVEGLSKTTDTHLMCTDGSIPVHGPLLAANSTVFKNVFLSQENNYFGVRTVILPDFKVEEMFLLVQFMYYGFVNITSLEDAELLKDLLVYFQVNVPKISLDEEARDISTIMYYCDSFGQGSDDDVPAVPELIPGNTSAESKDSFHQSMSSSFTGSEGGSEAGSDSKVTTGQKNLSEKTTSTSKVEEESSKTAVNGKGREVELEKIKSLVSSMNKSADSKNESPTIIATSSEATTVKPKIARTPTLSSASSDSEKVLPVTHNDEEEMKNLEHDENREESVEKELSPERFTRRRPGRRPGPKCKRSIRSRSPSESSVESAKKSRRISPSGATTNAEGCRTRSSDIETASNVSCNAQNSDEHQEDLPTIRRKSPRRCVQRSNSPYPNALPSNEATGDKNGEELNKTNRKITKANVNGSRVASALSGPSTVLVENKLERDIPSDLYSKPNELFDIGSECFVCRKRYENPVEASTCITEKHGMVRCYLCFSAVRTTAGLFDHYKRKHQKTSKDNTIICPFPDCEQTVSFSNLSTHCLALHVRKRKEFSTGNAGGNQQKKASSSSAAPVAAPKSPAKATTIETPKPRTSGTGIDKDKESRVPEKPKGLPKKGEFIITKDTGNGKPISYKTKY